MTDIPVPDPDAPASIAELLAGSPLPDTVTAALMITDPKITLRMLSQTLRLPVFGTRKPLLKSHSNSAGFDPAFAHILTVSRPPRPASQPPGTPFFR
jgi:hypothetical protein